MSTPCVLVLLIGFKGELKFLDKFLQFTDFFLLRFFQYFIELCGHSECNAVFTFGLEVCLPRFPEAILEVCKAGSCMSMDLLESEKGTIVFDG